MQRLKYKFLLSSILLLSINLLGQHSIIVQLEKDVIIQDWIIQNNEIHSFNHVKCLNQDLNIHLMRLHKLDIKIQDVVQNISGIKGVKSAQKDDTLEFRTTPNDMHFNKQWYLNHLNFPSFWPLSTGGLTANGDTIVVAILDAGFDTNHEDLKQNIWRNNSEIPNDGIDNDKNGYIDDINGWNFINNSNQHFESNHGTAVSGILGAKGNNQIGISGINWQIKMMLCSVNKVSDIIEAYSYLIYQRKLYHTSNKRKGALIVASNASLGISYVFCKDQPIWGAMYDKMGEVGILSVNSVTNIHIDVDKVGDMPTTCKSPYLISTLATDFDDQIVANSGFGPYSVDIGAPGINIYSTFSNNQYGFFNGTSVSAPQVCGAIALLYSIDCLNFANNISRLPKQTALSVKNSLLKGVDLMPINDSFKYSTTNGILNINKSFSILQSECKNISIDKIEITNIFPNPSQKGIVIDYFASNHNAITISIINSSGQNVYSQTLPLLNTWLNKRHYINTENIAAGIYWVLIQNGEHQFSRSFIIID